MDFLILEEIEKINGVKIVRVYDTFHVGVSFKNGSTIDISTPVSFHVRTNRKVRDIVKQIEEIAKQIKNIKSKVKAQLASKTVYEFEVEL